MLYEFKITKNYTKEIICNEWQVLINDKTTRYNIFYVRPSREYLDKYFGIKEGRIPYEGSDSFKIDTFDETWKSEEIRIINLEGKK